MVWEEDKEILIEVTAHPAAAAAAAAPLVPSIQPGSNFLIPVLAGKKSSPEEGGGGGGGEG